MIMIQRMSPLLLQNFLSHITLIYLKTMSKFRGGVLKSMLTLNEAIIDVKEG